MKDDTAFWMQLAFILFVTLLATSIIKGCSDVLQYHDKSQHVKVLNVINNAIVNDPETTCEAVEYELKKYGIDSLQFVPVRTADSHVIRWELTAKP